MGRDLFGVAGLLNQFASEGDEPRINAALLFFAALWRTSPTFTVSVVLLAYMVLFGFIAIVCFITASLFN